MFTSCTCTTLGPCQQHRTWAVPNYADRSLARTRQLKSACQDASAASSSYNCFAYLGTVDLKFGLSLGTLTARRLPPLAGLGPET